MSDPLAYLITWTVKGAWLHGDARGSVDRNQHRVGEPWLSPNPKRQRWEEQVLASETNTLTSTQREPVESAIDYVVEGQGAPFPPQQQDPRKPDTNEPPP